MAPSASTPPPLEAEPEFKARLDAAAAQGDAGDLSGTERALRHLLAEARGANVGNELWVLNYLVVTFGRAGRLFEALALARRYADLAREHRELHHLGVALAHVCGALHCMSLRTSLARALPELEALLPQLSGDTGTRVQREWHESNVVLHALDGNVDLARQHLLSFRALIGEDGRSDVDRVVTQMLEAQLELCAGDASRALEALDAMPGPLPPEPMMHLQMGWLRAWAYTDTRQPERALEEVAAFLEQSGALADDAFHAMARVHNLTEIAKLVTDKLDEPLLAHEAYDQLASAIVMRVAQLDRCVEELPELGLGDSKQEQELVAMRKQFVREQQGVMRRIAKLLHTTHKDAIEGLFHKADDEAWIRLCAWCERVNVEADRWIPVGHFVPRGNGLRMTHSICPACRKDWE